MKLLAALITSILALVYKLATGWYAKRKLERLERQRRRIEAAKRLETMSDKDVADEIDNKIN